MKNELISYALDFVSYLIGNAEGVNRVILFGSVARGDFDRESDIDLFIDTKNKKLASLLPRLIESYSSTAKARSWKLKGIEREFSCLVGELDSEEWRDLKRSIMNTGLILYGKYTAAAEKVHHFVIFSYGKIQPESKRVSVHRSLYGFMVGKVKYPGLIDKFRVVKLGAGCLLVPIEYASELKKFLQEKKVDVKLYDLWSDSKIMP